MPPARPAEPVRPTRRAARTTSSRELVATNSSGVTPFASRRSVPMASTSASATPVAFSSSPPMSWTSGSTDLVGLEGLRPDAPVPPVVAARLGGAGRGVSRGVGRDLGVVAAGGVVVIVVTATCGEGEQQGGRHGEHRGGDGGSMSIPAGLLAGRRGRQARRLCIQRDPMGSRSSWGRHVERAGRGCGHGPPRSWWGSGPRYQRSAVGPGRSSTWTTWRPRRRSARSSTLSRRCSRTTPACTAARAGSSGLRRGVRRRRGDDRRPRRGRSGS